MTTPGHNNPPPLEMWAMHIEGLFDLANGIGEATNDAQEAALDELLEEVRKARKAVDAERAAEKKPHDDAAKAVQARWAPLLARCDIAAPAIKAALTPYRTAKQAAIDAAAKLAREQAEAARIEALAAFQSSDLDDRLAAETKAAEAKWLAVQANKLDRKPTGLRTVWQAEVTDYTAALRYYAKADPDAIRALLQSLADKDSRNEATRRDIPGVTFHERKVAN